MEVDTALRYQLRHGRYEPSQLYGDGKSGERIARILGGELPAVQKEWVRQ